MHTIFLKTIWNFLACEGQTKWHPRRVKEFFWPPQISSVDRLGALSISTKHQMPFMCKHWWLNCACSEVTGRRCKWRHTEKILRGTQWKYPRLYYHHHKPWRDAKRGVRFMSECEHKVVNADRTQCLQAAFKCIGIEKQLRWRHRRALVWLDPSSDGSLIKLY